jgi:hypothetical protein
VRLTKVSSNPSLRKSMPAGDSSGASISVFPAFEESAYDRVCGPLSWGDGAHALVAKSVTTRTCILIIYEMRGLVTSRYHQHLE